MQAGRRLHLRAARFLPAAGLLSGCERSSGLVGALASLVTDDERMGSSRLLGAESAWYAEQLIEGNARPRMRVAVMPNGFYAPEITRDWRLKPAQRGTLVTQTRAIYVMASGFEVSGEEAFRDAMIRCADFLLTAFRHPTERGLFASEVSPEGKVLRSHLHLYGQMQAMFALAHAYRSSGEKRFIDAALLALLSLDLRRWLSGGKPDGNPRVLNVLLHAFEAVLALERAAPAKFLQEDLSLLGEYIRRNYLDEGTGRLVEFLAPDMKPLPEGPIKAGHTFQMAFLWSRAVSAGLPNGYLGHALRMIDFIAPRGIDDSDGSVPHEIRYDGGVRDRARHFWCQMETLRSLAHFIVVHRRKELRPRFDLAMRYSKANFIDPEYGGWYRSAGRPGEGKGSDWFAGYHEAMMWTEFLRLAGWRFKSGREMLL